MLLNKQVAAISCTSQTEIKKKKKEKKTQHIHNQKSINLEFKINQVLWHFYNHT